MVAFSCEMGYQVSLDWHGLGLLGGPSLRTRCSVFDSVNLDDAGEPFGLEAIDHLTNVLRLDFDANAVAPGMQRCKGGCARSGKWVDDGIACEAEHLNKSPW